jgi:hypothetical protein
MIYQFGDADKYYWVTLKQDNHLRRLETTIFAFSATSKEVEKLDASNSYFLEVSTHRKTVTFHTSTANGEPFSYDIQIDAGKGSVTVTDNVGNTILLDSKQSRVLLKNSSGTSFDLNKKSILAIAPTSFQIITDAFNVVAKSTLVEGSFTGSGSGVIGGSFKSSTIATGALTASSFNYPR